MTEENRRRLREGLEQLRTELENMDTDTATRQRLETLAQRVERQLAEEEKDEHHSLIRELEREILHFEVAHPRMTAIINDIMVALGNMGI